ncbi:MAG: hypothetical protein PHQ27_05280 [Victivallales bacterium]|nr:hypothetical protein [Victivallales bacterium]
MIAAPLSNSQLDFITILYTLVTWLPPVAFWSIAVITVIGYCRDRHRRRLMLMPSPEEEQIRELQHRGQLNTNEADFLLDRCHPLPRLREIVPLPDLALRLAAAYTQIVATMILLIFLAHAAFYITITLHKSDPGVTTTMTHTGNVAVLGIIFAAILLSALLQLAVAPKLLRGSLAARKLILGFWLVDFLIVSLVNSAYGSHFYGIMVVLAGVWVWYALWFRHGAAGRIRVDATAPSRRRRILAGVVVAAVIAVGQINIQLSPEFQLSHQHLTLNSIGVSCTTDSIFARPQSFHLLAGSPEPKVEELCHLLAQRLERETKIPCHVRRFGAPLAAVELNRTPVFMLDLANNTTPPPDDRLPPEIRRWFRNLIPISARRDQFAGKPTFRLRQMVPFGHRTFPVHGLKLPDLSFNISAAVDLDATSPATALPQVAEAMVQKISPTLHLATGPDAITLPPVFPPPAAAPPLLRLPGLHDVRRSITGSSNSLARIEVYTFRKGDYDTDLAAINRTLAARGYRQEDGKSASGDRIVFERQDHGPDTEEVWVDLGPRLNSQSLQSTPVPTVGQLAISIFRPYDAAQPGDHVFRQQFLAADPDGFLKCGGLRYLATDQQPDLLRKYFQRQTSFTCRQLVLTDLSRQEHSSDILRQLGNREFRRLTDDTLTLAGQAEFLPQACRLLQLAIDNRDPDWERIFMAQMQPYLLQAQLPAAVTADEKIATTIKLPLPPLAAVPWQKIIIFDLNRPQYRPVYMAFGILPAPNHTYNIFLRNASVYQQTDHLTRDQLAHVGAIYTWQRRDDEHRQPPYQLEATVGQTFSADDSIHRHDMPELSWSNPSGQITIPVQLQIRQQFEPQTGSCRLDVKWRPTAAIIAPPTPPRVAQSRPDTARNKSVR